jgi:predicted Zn-dependent protease
LRRLLLLASLAVMAVGCSSVPLTDRNQLRLVPAGQMLSLSRSAYSQTLDEAKVVRSGKDVEAVRRVGKRIVKAVNQLCATERMGDCDFEWELHVIEDDSQANAWCMPGGKMAVYTGILKYTQSDAGLATVMGHEVAHALARHGNERMSQTLAAQFGMQALAAVLRDRPQETQNAFLQAAGLGAQYGVLLPFSRMHESEADHIGLILMAMAGYDPQESIGFWQRMSSAGGAGVPEFLSTHPSGQTRIADLRGWMPEAMTYYKQYLARDRQRTGGGR